MNLVQKRAVSTGLGVTTGLGVMSYILPQNGVSEAPPQFGPGAAEASLDAQNGNVGASEAPKRPKDLGVTAGKGFGPVKVIRDESEDADGSLPCTPELHSDSEAEASGGPGHEALEADTRQLISRVLREHSGLSRAGWKESSALTTMKRVVGDVLDKHRYAYNGMINKLALDDRVDDTSFVGAVAKSMFADQKTNWGRIASLVAFGAAVSQRLQERGRGDCVEQVGQEIATYLLSDQRTWLLQNNAWDGFVEFFRVADPESTVRSTLMAFAGFAGIGATLALLIR